MTFKHYASIGSRSFTKSRSRRYYSSSLNKRATVLAASWWRMTHLHIEIDIGMSLEIYVTTMAIYCYEILSV